VSAGGAEEALGVAAEHEGGAVPGAVVPVGDVAALTGALRHWLTDPMYRRELRDRARVRRERLEGWDVTAQRVVAALTR
jgi:glycosyltransferase involved in cell wall biosynthesis